LLQQLLLAGFQLSETRERVIEIRDGLRILLTDQLILVEVRRYRAATALRSETGARAVDEKIAHDLGGQRQKTGAGGQVNAGCVDEAKVRLMDHFSRVERAFEWRAPQPAVCQHTQLVVEKGDELIAGAYVPRAPSPQENRDVRRGGFHFFRPGWVWKATIPIRQAGGKR
jgi:hypothetical protein